ncbi:hypothetical protein P879_07882 [Paragonimus westermani]|uniref:Uncharacterized protein n=1 Tax=Paragonimus westermani TaxID=34504 RepID=A0A8T0DPC6_9TREM|nr:hypothetical protein P879_07882 [Paragonimus westermani]
MHELNNPPSETGFVTSREWYVVDFDQVDGLIAPNRLVLRITDYSQQQMAQALVVIERVVIETESFDEDKPRPAPVFGSNSASVLPQKVKFAEVTVCDSSDSSNAVHTQIESPIIRDKPIGQPVSTQVFLSSTDHRLPPRATSDARYMNTGLNHGERLNGQDVHYVVINGTVASRPLVDEEDYLIPKHSRESSEQGEPHLVSKSSQNLFMCGSSLYMQCILDGISPTEMSMHVSDLH